MSYRAIISHDSEEVGCTDRAVNVVGIFFFFGTLFFQPLSEFEILNIALTELSHKSLFL